MTYHRELRHVTVLFLVMLATSGIILVVFP
jgi:hypothetical protein